MNEGFNSNRIAVCDEGCCELEAHYNALNDKYQKLCSVAREMYKALEHPETNSTEKEKAIRNFRTNLYILGAL